MTISVTTTCANPNYFSGTLAPAIEKRLPDRGSFASTVIDHTTKLPSFLDTVSVDLCDDGRMGGTSRDAALGFIARSTTTAVLAAGTVGLAAVGIAAAGAPVAVAGLGIAALAVLPPVAERLVQGIRGFLGELMDGVHRPE